MRKPEAFDLVAGTAVAVIVILIGTLVDRALDLLDLRTVAIGVALSIVIVLGVVAVVWALGRQSHEAQLKRTIDELKTIASSSKYEWLQTVEDLVQLEEHIKCKEIWVCSPDLSYDTGSPDIDTVKLVQNNVKRGIIYTYVVPDTEEIEAVLPHLRRIFSFRPSQLKVIKLPKYTFDTLTID